MATNFKFEIMPSRALYPEFPSFDLFVKKKVNGWVWTEETFTWSCLPGYTRENLGAVDYDDYSDNGGKGYSFYLNSRPLSVFEKATNPCYGILSDIPTDFAIGSKGFATIHYGGAKVKQLLLAGKSENVLYCDWTLVNVY